MSSVSFSRRRTRALSIAAISLMLVSLSLVWARRQQAANRLFKSAGIHSLVHLFLDDKSGITPAAATITVNSLSDATNSSDGLCTLREAIAAANSNTASGAVAGECVAGSSSGSDTINLTSLSGTIAVSTALPAISSNLNLNGPGSAVLTIQRTGSFAAISINSPSVVAISGLTFDGGGNAQVGPPGNFGIATGGTLNLSNSTVTGFGSGISDGQNVLTITNCLIINNTAGSGITSSSGSIVNVINSTVSNNDSHGAFGGGINNSFGTLNVTNSTITGNKGDYGINNGGTATIINTTISNNPSGGVINNGTMTMTGGLVTGNGNHGILLGNISAGTSSLLNGVTITNNSAVGTNGNGGGGVFISSIASTIMNCLISNNTTDGFGGGIRNGGGKATIINTTISGNSASGGGGGMDIVDGGLENLVAINVTITNNHAGTGAGVFRESGPVRLKNSIVAGNSFFSGPSTSDISGTIDSTSSFNLIGTGGAGGLTNGVNNNQVGVADAKLGPLANNGGPTQTHALLANSPALDAGDNCVTDVAHCGDAAIAQILTDQRGLVRSVDGPDANTTATIDIGAYEAQGPLANLPDISTLEDTQILSGFDPGDASTVSSVTASSSNSTVVPNDASHLTAAINGTTGVVTMNPAADVSGTSNITVTVNRTGGGSEVKTFLLTVTAVNDAPTFVKGPDQVVNEDAGPQTFANWATVAAGPPDEASQTLTFSMVDNTNVSLFSAGPAISSTGTLTFTTTPNANGTATVTFRVKDSGGTTNGGVDTSPNQTFVITVNPVNDAPTFVKGPDKTVNEDSGAQASGWGSVSSGASNEFQTLTSQIINNTNPGLFSVAPAVSSGGTLSFTPAPNANGSATITMVMQDNGGTANGGVDTSAPQTFTINVTPVNDPPSFLKGPNQAVANNAGAQTVNNWATSISPGPADESGQTVGFQIISNSNLSIFSVTPAITPTGTLTFTPAPNANGIATFLINLKDSGGTANGGGDTSQNQSFTISVSPDNSVQFTASSSNTTENSGSITVNVSRTGDVALPATVNYSTNNDQGVPCSTASGAASPKCDFTAALGTLNFAAAETSKSITILISQDSFVEGPEVFTVTLSNPTGAVLGTPASMSITIADDVTEPATNIIDDPNMFVRMHYHDFLNREADQSGLDFWTGQTSNCGASDLLVCRVNVSGAFFLSIEFQQTGYLVERVYKTAYADATATSNFNGGHLITVPIVRANEFLADTQRIGRGVIVLQPGWEQVLESNKQAYALEFVQTPRFVGALPTSITPPQFVDRLNINAGFVLSASERTAAINLFGNSANTANINARAQVLRQIAEDPDLYNAELNRAFVLTQYIGYLRRNPDDAPEPTLDYTGYDFWLTKLNANGGDYIKAEMVKAFIASDEYRKRFGP